MSNLKKNTLYNGILSVSNILYPLIIFPYLTRILNPEGLGIISYVNSIVQYFLIFANFGISIYGVREIAKSRNNKEELSKTFYEIFFLRLLTTTIVLTIYLTMLYFIKHNITIDFLKWGSLIILLSILDLNWFFQGIENFKFITIRTVLFHLLIIVLSINLVRNSNDALISFQIPIFLSGFLGLINLFFALKSITIINIKKIKEYSKINYKPALLIFGSTLAINIYMIVDNILLGYLTNMENVAFYSLSVKLVKIPITLLTVVSPVLIPSIINLLNNNKKEEVKILINKSIELALSFSIPLIVIFLALAPEIITIFAGNKFNESIIIIRYLTPLIILLSLSNIFGLQILIPLKKDFIFLKIVTLGLFINLILNFMLIPIYSYFGAVISSIVTELYITIATYFQAKKYLYFQIPIKIIKTTLLINLIYLLGIMLIKITISNLYTIISIGIIFTTIFFYIVYSKIHKKSILHSLVNNPIKTIFK